MGKQYDEAEEEMTVELELDDGSIVTCAIITILEVEGRDYIVLMPLDETGRTRTAKSGSTAIPKIRMIPTRSPPWITSTTMRNTRR